MNIPPTVSPKEWETAREELLVKEKAVSYTHLTLPTTPYV